MRGVVMAEPELSPVAVIVLGYLTRAASRLNVVQLSARARIPLGTVQAAVEELVGARRRGVAGGGGGVVLPPYEIDPSAATPTGPAQQYEGARQRWRIRDLLSGEQPARDDNVEPIHGMSA